MSYRDNIKVLMRRGKVFRMQGQGLSGGRMQGHGMCGSGLSKVRSRIMDNLKMNSARMSGTIASRPIVDKTFEEDLKNMSIKTKGGSTRSKKGTFNPLKFNF